MMLKVFDESDAGLDPQALIISPDSSVAIAQAIVSAEDHYHAGIASAREAIRIMRDSSQEGSLKMDTREAAWLDRMEDELDDLPDSEEEFVDEMMEDVDTDKFVPEDYELPVPLTV